MPVNSEPAAARDALVVRSPRRPRLRERSPMVRLWRLVRTARPRSFTAKVRYKMLRDHRDILVTFADKWAVRQYIAAAVGSDHLPVLLAVVDDPADLLPLDLPPSYVVKPTHGSGAVIVVSPAADAGTRLPPVRYSWVYRHVRAESANRLELAAIGAHWLGQLYGRGPNCEWVYSRIPPRILVEELLQGPGGSVPDDYKFFVFHGRCHFVQVDAGRFGRRTQDFFLRSWEHLPFSGGPPWAEPPPPRPHRLDEMMQLAERLGAPTDFVRVDLYLLPDRIVVGELTNYPAGGDSPFNPPHFDEIFGRPWTVPRRYL